MKSKKPLIGVTPWYDYEKQNTYVNCGYNEGIMEAGGLPLLIPVTVDTDHLGQLVELFDGFLLCGGPDIDPKYYGEPVLPGNGNISPYRDAIELYAVREAVRMNKPVFGICRGIQLLNVALGGTLYQDITSQPIRRLQPAHHPQLLRHWQEAPKWYPIHDISIEPGSRVFEAFSTSKVSVNSFHHQAVNAVAPDLAVTSCTADGIIESVEHKNHRFCVGVQWHPELMWEKERKHLRLFEMFVGSCRSTI